MPVLSFLLAEKLLGLVVNLSLKPFDVLLSTVAVVNEVLSDFFQLS